MFVTLEQIQNGVVAFADREIGQKAIGFQKFATYFVIASYKNKIADTILKFKDNPMISTLGLFDENSNVDIDTAYSAAKAAIKKSGKFTLSSITFDESDIDKLYEHIINGG